MKWKTIKHVTMAFSISLFIGLTAHVVYAEESSGFSVTPVLEENQIEAGLGYFNLLLKPEQKQTLKFNITNNGKTPVEVETSFGTAFTGDLGNVLYTPNKIKPDSSLKINIKDYVKLPKTVTVPAHGKTVVSAEVTMPHETFKGVIAGGFNFNEKENGANTKGSEGAKSGASITNRYTYVIGLVLQNSKDKVDPALSLGTVTPSQVNGRNVISANLKNSAMTYLLDMNTDVEVTKLNDSSIKYSFDNATSKMAPNSNFNLGIPVSIQGALKNGQSSVPLKAGKYQLEMTVYGNKNTNGKYQSMVEGQVTKYDYKWTFSKEFEITGNQAKTLNEKDVTIDHVKETPWMLYGLGLVILALTIIIFILVYKSRKKKQEIES
ncbi:MAG: DUF916 and DUF3324 domain-containing protein [Streptococcaceae bacterium]|nr:DUF916 and DUF3324 domain-containing protein [Streptococcaceae bacterium]